MRHLVALTLLLAVAAQASSQDIYEARQKRTEWFRDARFGMFIHWGVYAIPGRGEWVRNQERLTIEQYQPYVDAFNPVDYNPREWAHLARQAGMRYAVITAKHHDGFCLFDSKYTDYKATKTPAGRDLIREFVDAFRAEGLKVGFYYSLIDWHHPDYPNVGNHPMAHNKEWDAKTYHFDRYLDYLYNQVEELVTNYGKIDILWFDYSFGEYSGDKWRATKLVNMVRAHQPGIIIDNRLGGHMERANPEPYAGDFEGPEQIIPSETMIDDLGRLIPWESCITLNTSWGYKNDMNYKSATQIIRILVECVSKNGNLLLNVGPDARGNIPPKSVEILKEVGDWMKLNSESIYGCGPAQFAKPEWGRYTQKGEILYAHVMEPGIKQFYLKKLKGKVRRANFVFDGSEVVTSGFWNGDDKPYVARDDLFMYLGGRQQEAYPLPDPRDTVIRLELVE